MKHLLQYKIIKLFLPLAITTLCGCGSHDNGDKELKHDHSHHAHEEAEGHTHSAEEENAHSESEHKHGEIVFSHCQAEKFGVETDTVRPGQFNEIIRVTGQITDNPTSQSVVSAPTAGIVKFMNDIEPGRQVAKGTAVATISSAGVSGGDRNVADKAALSSAKRELDRITPLYKEGIVSAKDYNAALQVYESAKAQYSPAAATGTAKAMSAGAISQLLTSNGQYVEAGTPIATIGSNQQLTLRADLPDKYINEVPMIQSARIYLPSTGQTLDLSALDGKRISGNPSTRISSGYIPVYFTFKSGGKALPSTFADVYLIGKPRSGVIAVPNTAIIEQQGHYFVYIKLDEDCYEKVPVTTGASDGKNIEILTGLKGGECVVAKGAFAIRLAETSSVVPEGHSHSH